MSCIDAFKVISPLSSWCHEVCPLGNQHSTERVGVPSGEVEDGDLNLPQAEVGPGVPFPRQMLNAKAKVSTSTTTSCLPKQMGWSLLCFTLHSIELWGCSNSGCHHTLWMICIPTLYLPCSPESYAWAPKSRSLNVSSSVCWQKLLHFSLDQILIFDLESFQIFFMQILGNSTCIVHISPPML